MLRKNDAHKDDLEGVAQRLRDERPEASPLELDRIKTTAMSRARGSKVGRAGTRRFAVGALTLGMLAAGTGGVLAGQHGHGNGNAASAQYSSCDTGNNDGTTGSTDNNGSNGFNCNNNSGNGNGSGNTIGSNNGGNTTTINNSGGNTTTTNNSGGNTTTTNDSGGNTTTTNDSGGNTTSTTTTNNSTSYVTITYAPPAAAPAVTPAASGVLASKTSSTASVSKRHISAHFFAAHGKKLKKLTVTVDGKVVKTLSGNGTTVNLDFVGFPCSPEKEVVVLKGVLSNGKHVTETRHFNLCQ
jgi:hypothetical protein